MTASPPGGGSAAGVVVVGAGISGIACAQALRGAGVPVRVLDRGRRAGGRLGQRRVQLADGSDHVVDTGAAYFTVSDPGFAAVVDGWSAAGLARPWTDTMAVLAADGGPDGRGGVRERKTGPQRWAAPGGLRGLVDHLADGLDVTQDVVVRSVGVLGSGIGVDAGRGAGREAAAAVVLAMPDPQAGRLLDVSGGGAASPASPHLVAARRVLSRPWSPVISTIAVWDERWWPDLDAGFVDGDDLLTLVADDGSRRGDGAPVLVAHSTAAAAAEHLGAPEELLAPVLERLPALLGVTGAPAPRSALVQRWSFSSPDEPHEDPHLLTAVGDGLLGVCGDAWGGRSKVERAWTSGRDLGRALAERLAA